MIYQVAFVGSNGETRKCFLFANIGLEHALGIKPPLTDLLKRVYNIEVADFNNNGLLDDFNDIFVNGDIRKAIDLVELYNVAFGTSLDYNQMFTDESCPYYIGEETLKADVQGVGNAGDPNPFYLESGNWSPDALEGIEEYVEILAQADVKEASADALDA